MGGTELSGTILRAGVGAAFSQAAVLAEAIVPFLTPSHAEIPGGCHICFIQPG